MVKICFHQWEICFHYWVKPVSYYSRLCLNQQNSTFEKLFPPLEKLFMQENMGLYQQEDQFALMQNLCLFCSKNVNNPIRENSFYRHQQTFPLVDTLFSAISQFLNVINYFQSQIYFYFPNAFPLVSTSGFHHYLVSP